MEIRSGWGGLVWLMRWGQSIGSSRDGPVPLIIIARAGRKIAGATPVRAGAGSLRLVAVVRRRDAGGHEAIAQVLDFLLGAHIAVMRVVQVKLVLVEHNPETRALDRFHARPELLQQGLDFAPMNIVAQRVAEDGLQEAA
ncbi:hypothetical protein [Cupriavidus basilensis]|uniref:hypothetical protein n=1 Tax=Cupriavidus basilensis TaxID=68895 RepID=UPI001300C423|nr:hypothetical protein [Cupriavidus basilensis]